MILDCQNISKAFGTNVILDNVSFHLEDKEKMAIVGINGAGKTTLLKIIMQEEEADSGQIVLSKDRTIGYLSQHQDIFYDDTVYGVMEDAMKPVIELQDKIRKLEQDMTTLTGDELKAALSTYNRYTHEFEYKNGYAYESEITGVLKGLGFSKEDFNRHTDTLSGGQKTRLSLGRLLLTKPDIIILDEPTAFLDVVSRIAFISMLFQCFDDLFHIIRKCDLHSLISPFCYSVCNFSRYFHSLDVKSTELFSAIPPVSVSEQNYRNVKNKITRIPSTIRYQPKILKSCFLM